MKGSGGGGKRRTRKPTGIASAAPARGAVKDARSRGVDGDDRPRGFEAARMRQLWSDIDASKRKAGLGRTPEPEPAPGWDVGTVIERAAALIGDAAAWVTANAPAAIALLATGAELLRNVPVVGRLVELMPPAEPPKPVPPPRSIPPVHTNGTAHTARDPDEISDPDGGWIH